MQKTSGITGQGLGFSRCSHCSRVCGRLGGGRRWKIDCTLRSVSEISDAKFDRRTVLSAPLIGLGMGVGIGLTTVQPSWAFTPPPQGFRLHQDKLDGYNFFLPNNWIPTTTAGNDVAFRNPAKVSQNVFVNISSPSSSKYRGVDDLGTPDDAAKRVMAQLVTEFMSTRIGVRREAELVSAEPRTGVDGKLYYDVEVRIKSFASRNQLASTQDEVEGGVQLEWDRRLTTVLGVANRRLYEFRIQDDYDEAPKDQEVLSKMAQSFQCKEVVT